MLPDLQQVSGKYEILRKLNEGGMGAIYLVRHRLLDELRVIKVMRAQIRDEKDFRDRFVREARTAIQLRHPNIAQLYEFELDDQGTAYMVLEFIDGRTLEELIASRAIGSLRLKVEIALQCLRALAFLHRKGFVHRDIAPDNFMLTRDQDGGPQAKLLDLGIVKVLRSDESLTGTAVFLGKFRYASPEQLESSHIDARSDLYSFGILLYELLTGVYPIPGNDVRSIMSGHLLKPPIAFADSDPLDEIPEELRRIVLKALEKKPESRFPSAEEFATRLRGVRLPEDQGEDLVNLPINLDRILGERGRLVARPGTTQANLDAKFDVSRKTPSYPEYPPEAQRSIADIKSRFLDAEALLARGDLDGAESAAHALLQRPHLPQELLDRTRELADRIRALRCTGLLTSARTALSSGSTTQAIDLLNRVLKMDPENSSARNLIDEISRRLEREALEERRAEVKAALAHELGALLAQGRFRDARRRLEATTSELLRAEDLAALEAEIRAAEAADRERRRAAELALVAADVASAIKEGRYTDARARLAPPEGAAWTRENVRELAQEIEEAEAGARARRYDQGIQHARALLGEDRLDEARQEIARLRKVQALDALGEGIAREIERRGEELKRREAEAAAREAERARQVALAELTARVRARTRRGEFEEARQLVADEGVAGRGEPELAGLLREVEEAEAAERATRYRAVMEEAESLLRQDRLEEARSALAKAKDLGALDREGKKLQGAIETAARKRRAEEERRAQQAEEARKRAEAERLRREEEERVRIEAEQRQAEALASARESLARANELFERGDLVAAESALGAARSLPVLANEVRELERKLKVVLDQREARQRREERRRGAVHEVERLLAAGELAQASALLELERQAFPDDALLGDLGARIETAIGEREEANRQERELEARLEDLEAAVADERLEVGGALLADLEGDLRAEKVPKRLRGRLREARRRLEASRSELARRAAPAPAPPFVATDSTSWVAPAEPAARAARGRVPWLVAGGAVAAVLAVVLFVVARGGERAPASPVESDEGPTPVTLPVAPELTAESAVVESQAAGEAAPTAVPAAGAPESPAIAVANGSVLVDASPWGEVESVLRVGAGEVTLPADRFTPLLLELEPGRYRVQIAHSELGRRTVEVEVTPGRRVEARTVFEPDLAGAFLTGRSAGAGPR